MMQIHPYGDSAILVNFEQKIDPEINARVISLTNALANSSLQGVHSYIPAYCSVVITYDPLIIVYDELCSVIEKLEAQSKDWKAPEPRILNIPVCYEGYCNLDLEEVQDQTGVTIEKIIQTHTSTQFQVYMLGFLPGFVYMGSLPQSLSCSRKSSPRLKVPPRSVGLAGLQTGIYPSSAPGGWQIIGRTPLNIFDPKNDKPFLFQAGDRVHFHAIALETFEEIERDIDASSFNIDKIYG